MIKDKLLYSRFKVEGLNLGRFIETLKKRNVTVYDVIKKGKKTLLFTVSKADEKKIFANFDNVWYNYKKTKEEEKKARENYAYILTRINVKGALSLTYFLYKNIGVLIGIILFIVGVAIYSELLLKIEYTGSGSILEREISEYLQENGVKKFTFFGSVSERKLENGLKTFPEIEFVSIKRKGNRLIVFTELKSSVKGIIDSKEEKLYSSVDGVIENIKVYRGIAVVKIGDEVKKGDLLVDGEKVNGEIVTKTYVLASVSIISEFKFSYSGKDGEEDYSLVLAKEALGEYDVLDSSIIKEEADGVFLYEVLLKYRQVLYGG